MHTIEQNIQNAVQNNTSFIIAIDGHAGSGKTTLVNNLKKQFPIDVISMDDFFLPFEMKTPERLASPGNNFYHERFITEIVPNIHAQQPWSYKAYNCQTNTYATKHLKGTSVKVVEGVYSCHPLLQSIYDYKVALHINETEQKHRILKRNGEFMWEKFKTLWIPQENAYFHHFKVFEACDVVLEMQGYRV